MDSSQLLLLLARVVVASVFLMAALTKLPRAPQFAEDVRQYRLGPSWSATAYAVSLPWLELAAAASLLTGVSLPIGTGVALFLLGTFLVAAAAAMARGLDLTCSCFGLLYRERVGWPTLTRDALLAGLVLAVLLFDSGRFAIPTIVRSLPQPIDVLALAVVLVALIASVVLALPRTERAPAAAVGHTDIGHEERHRTHAHAAVD